MGSGEWGKEREWLGKSTGKNQRAGLVPSLCNLSSLSVRKPDHQIILTGSLHIFAAEDSDPAL